MRRQQSGFTLIELVMVIVILGILAATALPRFVDLQGDARNAAAQGVTGALRSAATIAYAHHRARNLTASAALPADDQYITNCATLLNYLEGNAWPTDTVCAADAAGVVTVTLPNTTVLTLTAETNAAPAALN